MDIQRLPFLVFDCEIYAEDWIAVFMERDSKIFHVFHNDPDFLAGFLEQRPSHILTGFNVKHYDRWVLSAIVRSGDPAAVKKLSDFIINGGEGWEYPDKTLTGERFALCDLRDDCRQGLSLKEFEGHMGMDICETDVPFDIDRRLTEPETESVVKYCLADVKATDRLFDLRIPYLSAKLTLAEESGISPEKALYMTNAKLTAAYLGAVRREYDDERKYVCPDRLKREYIPSEVFDFFGRMRDETVPDEELFGSRLEIEVGGCPVTLGFGGIHGALPCYSEDAAEGRSIRNVDVASYYPHQMAVNGYCSRSMPSPERFKETIARRIAAKKAGDKATADALKLVVNTTFGAMLNPYNDLYDPLMARSVCVSGQLQLLELASHLARDCPTLRIIQLNTDGVMVSLGDPDLPAYREICREWQERCGFTLEEDAIRRIVQKDVNNYVEVPMEGPLKVKGGALTRGISAAGAFNINNNAVAVAKAVTAALAYGVPPEETIENDGDILDFQLIAKAGSKFDRAFIAGDGGETEAQRVSRVYAAPMDGLTAGGTLYKRHRLTGTASKIAGLPPRCLVDDRGELTTDDIGKDWYTAEARRLIRSFLGQPDPDRKKLNGIKKRLLASLDDGQMRLI